MSDNESRRRKAKVGALAGGLLTIIGSFSLFQAIGHGDSSRSDSPLAIPATLLGCIGLPAGAVTLLLSLMFFAVNAERNQRK